MSLSAREEARAASRRIYVLWYAFEAEDSIGNELTWAMPLVIHRFLWMAKLDANFHTTEPTPQGAEPGGRYIVDGPVNLLAFARAGFCSEANLRAALGWPPVNISLRRRWYHPSRYAQSLAAAPLTSGELKQASQIKAWTIYYEDRFHVGDARDSFPVAVCLTEEEAEAELKRRGKPVEPGSDGYLIHGPYPLAREGDSYSEIGAEVVREALRRAAAGEAGPIAVK